MQGNLYLYFESTNHHFIAYDFCFSFYWMRLRGTPEHNANNNEQY